MEKISMDLKVTSLRYNVVNIDWDLHGQAYQIWLIAKFFLNSSKGAILMTSEAFPLTVLQSSSVTTYRGSVDDFLQPKRDGIFTDTFLYLSCQNKKVLTSWTKLLSFIEI